MHGEYKVHQGKLVVVDLEVQDDKIIHARVAGDFFLEPAEALQDIQASLIGLSKSASAAEIVSAITQKLSPDTAMIGFSPEAVAIATRRALGVEKTWRDYEWEIIQTEPLSPAMHLALDEVLGQEVSSGKRAPTLRFWEWSTPAIIIGCFQSLMNEVDRNAAERLGIDVVRRITGGGAMFVEPQSAVTYSLYAPGELVKGMSFADSYAFLDSWVLKALNALGIDAHYKPLNDITSSQGKIGGAAQKRFVGGGVLHHVTMAYDMDAQKLTQVLRIGREKLSDKGTASAAKRVDPLRSQTGLSRQAIIERMKQTFIELNGGKDGTLKPQEIAAAQALIATKFKTEKWLNHVL